MGRLTSVPKEEKSRWGDARERLPVNLLLCWPWVQTRVSGGETTMPRGRRKPELDTLQGYNVCLGAIRGFNSALISAFVPCRRSEGLVDRRSQLLHG